MFSFFNKSNQSNVTVNVANEELKDSKDNVLIDVREAGEYKNGHASGAISYPLSIIEKADLTKLKDYKKVFVICNSGARSKKAAEYLKTKNINAINVSGGTMSWIMNGLPIYPL